ncbi:2-amino-4-hydroxy-6-hydroxymethyldihydropteridine diphosphokinase [Phenylobacterium kunshanense]|uniref:2-amino-4-hydroxy-6- hydroxymethyldihydropteridine diphosphokinase n=1 Tax=Phenylobacterium kunshanense TaxID=1445034 RepID=UPI00140223F3|nr:2-amino-4-hydroxy-6-hydroxymethyldihydropteridine diphosphokinase [Phenylobacterium kunshanense]
MVVALGSNLAGDYGSCEALLEAALARFPSVGLKIQKRSGWWRSAAWPDPNAPEYRNGVALVEANAGPEQVLVALLDLEAAMGRERAGRNAPRTLDLDLIAHGREVRDAPGLVLPHPRAHERRFVMGPLAEIAPAWTHPVLGLTAAALAAAATVGRDATPIRP